MHAFDRQTDGQTDRNLIVMTALHSMQRGKNVTIHVGTKHTLSAITSWLFSISCDTLQVTLWHQRVSKLNISTRRNS